MEAGAEAGDTGLPYRSGPADVLGDRPRKVGQVGLGHDRARLRDGPA